MGGDFSAAILDYLRKNQSPVLQGLGEQNAHLKQLIEEHEADFLRLIYEPVEGQGNPLGQLASAAPEAVSVDLEEHEAIEPNHDQEDLDGEDHKVSRSEATKALNATEGDFFGDTVELNKDDADEDLDEENDKGGKTIDTVQNKMGGNNLVSNCRGKKVRRAGACHALAGTATLEQRHVVQPTPLLTGLENHPSIYVRLGQRPTEPNFVSQNTWVRASKIWSNLAGEYRKLLQVAGFWDFLQIQPFKIRSGGYMTALVERYFPETHTVHIGSFEFGPTPLAWSMITGIRFGGDPLNPPDITMKECAELLGFKHTEGFFSNGELKLDVLCSDLDFSKSPNKKDLDWMFRRLIVYLVGSCFFSGAEFMVPIRLVSAMRDIWNIKRYDWGAATFSAFLRGMRQRTSECSGTFTGFWPFLLLWAYEHIPCMRPLSNLGPDIFPRACRWNSSKKDVINPNDLAWCRLELEYLEEDEVIFDPYEESWLKEYFRHERALSQKRIAFQGLESWEVYMGERNLCQFGGGIRIPHSPPAERFGENLPFPTTVARELWHGVDAWDLVEDEECDYAEWFRANSLGRIVALDQFEGRKLLGGRVLELWLKVHKDGYKVISPQDLQALKDETTKLKEKLQNAEAKLMECMAENETLVDGLDH